MNRKRILIMLNNGDLTSKLNNNTSKDSKEEPKNTDYQNEVSNDTKVENENLNKKTNEVNSKEIKKSNSFYKIFNINPIFLFFIIIITAIIIIRMNIFGIKDLIQGKSNNQNFAIQSDKNEEKRTVLDEVSSSNTKKQNTQENTTNFEDNSENLSKNIMIDESVRNANIKINSFIEKIHSTNVIYDNNFIALINNKLYKEGDPFTEYGKIEKINLVCKNNSLPVYKINIINKKNKNYNFSIDIPLINGKKITFTFDAIAILDKVRNKENIIFEGEGLYDDKIVLEDISELDNYQLKFNYKCNNKKYSFIAKDGEVVSK